MRYLGSKRKIAGKIAGLIEETRRFRAIELGVLPGYWEPMVGGLSVFHKIRGGIIYGSDVHPWLIACHHHAHTTGWRPPKEVDINLYNHYNDLAKQGMSGLSIDDIATAGFVGFACSHSGKWFASFAREERGVEHTETVQQRSYAYKINRLDRNAVFFEADFMTCDPPERHMVIYCDPPYNATEPYKTGNISKRRLWKRKQFNHNLFWDRVRQLEGDGHVVLVSEYQAPSDFSCVLSMNIRTGVRTREGGNELRVEKIFRYGEVTPVQGTLL